MKTSLHLSPSVRLFGARQSLLSLLKHLDPKRWRPVAVLPFGRDGLADALRDGGLSHHTVRMGQWRKAKYWIRIPHDLRRLRHIAKHEHAALVHCNEPHSAPYGLHVAKRRGIPCVVHVRLDNIDARLIRNYHLHRADCIVAVSRAVANQIVHHWPTLEKRVIIVPNGVDAEALRAMAPDRAEARRNLGAQSEDDILIGQIGLISPRKQCHMAIEAFAPLAKQFPRSRLLFIGSPGHSDRTYSAALNEDIRRRGLLGRVQLLPFRRDIEAIFAALDLNLLISTQEGFGRVLIEAAAFGVPSIGTHVGGIPEVIRDRETGLLIPPKNAHALQDALRALMLDPDMRRRLGEEAKRDTETDFSIATHTRKMMEVFDSMV